MHNNKFFDDFLKNFNSKFNFCLYLLLKTIINNKLLIINLKNKIKNLL